MAGVGTAARLPYLRWASAGKKQPPVRAGRGAPLSPQRREYDIPGLEPITYADRMHYVPGLARPPRQEWVKDWHDPHYRHGPRLEDMPLRREQPCYVFNQRTRVLEGEGQVWGGVRLRSTTGPERVLREKTRGTKGTSVKQALWLTKSKLIEGLPEKILKISEDSASQFENQDELVQQVIARACLWSSKETEPEREQFCPALLQNLLHFCKTLDWKYPFLSRRTLAENYRLGTTWCRESDLFQLRGLNGTLLNARSPLGPLASKDEILATEKHVLETFYPISPTIDLQETYVYREVNDTGFREGYPYAYPHTLYLTDLCNQASCAPFKPEHLRAKMIMFAFGNALANANKLYGEDAKVLEHPVVVQSVATDGKLFQFVVVQLNTTDLNSSDGVKNLVWLDSDQMLYDYAKYLPTIKKKVVVVPAGVFGYQPETFRKFLAMYLHGAM